MADAEVTWFIGELRAIFAGPAGPVAADTMRRAGRVLNAAKRDCPVGTPESTGKPGYRGGTLRRSLTRIPGIDGEGFYVDVGTRVYYGIYVDQGTYKMAARPFLTGNLDQALL